MKKILEKVRTTAAQLKVRGELRKRLRGPAQLQYAIADSISLLSADAWHAATANSGFFLSRDYLAAMEKVLPANISPRYALIYDRREGENVPIAAMVMQLIDISLAQTRPATKDKDKNWLKPLSEKIDSTSQRILACGNFLTFGQHGVALASDNNTDATSAWHGVAEVLYRVRQSEKLVGKTHFVMIKDLHAPFTANAKTLENLSYRYVETEPDMVLALDAKWKSYDDYLGGLASKYRSSIRNAVLKPIEEAGCTIERLTDVAAVQDEMHALYKAVQVNASFRPYTLSPAYFAALQSVAGDRFRCSVVRQNKKLVGFLISVGDGDTAIAYHIGFDRTAAQDLPVYLRLLHAGIADAIDLGCKQISFGRTALEPKAALGAKPRTFGVLVRHRQPVLNKLIKHVLMGIEHEDAPERNPFKKAVVAE